jgi:ribosomal protein RSM22 (predicted rRNA methylase)
MDTDLPSDLQAGLDKLAEGVSRSALGERAAIISQTYRSGGGSAGTIQSGDDALAYAMARLPATFAAAAAALAAIKRALPDFAPQMLLDVGSGPGTASWAAMACFTHLKELHLVDENPYLRELALELLASSREPALRNAAYQQGAARQLLPVAERADLVIASYFVGEIPADQVLSTADALWSSASNTLIVIEPGTPAGFERIRKVRSHLIGQGGSVICPCPHDAECPMTGDDWCHFSQRLNRSRDHRQVKGAALSFEDEKFSYVALARSRSAVLANDRVLAPPHVTKAQITTKLCTAQGLVADVASRRDRDAYKMRKNWRWGDAVSRTASSPARQQV